MTMIMVSVVLNGLIFFSGNVTAATYVSGNITSNTTWTVANSPYIIVDDVTVDNGTILTINPGVTVKFDGLYSLVVNGTLYANGTAAKPIIFTSNQSSPAKGDWNRIRLHGKNNTMDFCEISYGHYPLYIMGENSNNTIFNCKVSNNTGDGIYIKRSSKNLIYNTTVANSHSNGITLLESQYNTINNSFFKLNKAFGIYLRSSANNSITNSNSFSNDGGGIELGLSSDNITMHNVRVYLNDDTGIDFNGNGFNEVTDSHVYNNTGPGIDLGGSSFDNLINNTEIDNNVGAGIELDNAKYVDIVGCNIHDNQGEAGIYADKKVEHINITNTKILNNIEDGIELYGGNWVNITNSNITSNLFNGINLNGSKLQENCWIQNCTISNNGLNGIYFYATSDYMDNYVQGNNITSNEIYSNSQNGIFLKAFSTRYNYKTQYVQHNIICYNTIYSNINNGIILETKALTYHTYNSIILNNSIFNNTIFSNNQNGIILNCLSDDRSSYISHNNILRNKIFSNKENGIYFVTGPSSYYDYDRSYIQYNDINNNTIYLNTKNGIYFDSTNQCDYDVYFQKNIIHNNSIYSNGENGIYFYAYSRDYSHTLSNKIYSNLISSNNQNGIYLHSHSFYHLDFQFNSIYSNVIHSNNNGIEFFINAYISHLNSPIWYAGYFENNKIILNDIYSNDLNGIYFNYRSRNGFFYNQYNELYSNNIYNNVKGSGIYAEIDNCNISSWQKSVYINNTINYNSEGIRLIKMKSQVVNLNNISNNLNNGITLDSSSDNIFGYNKIRNNNGNGVELTAKSSYNKVRNNNFTGNNQSAVAVNYNSNNNIISRNAIFDHPILGINVSGATKNYIHHNNLVNNTKHAYDSTTQLNDWDDSVEGNWWDDYKGFDANNDGIGDIPYDVPGGGSKDWYPIMKPANIVAPIVEDPSPPDGAIGVSVTPTISLSFSNKMNKSATQAAISMSGGIALKNFNWTNGDMTVSFQPAVTLSSSTKYTITVSLEAKDILENYLANIVQISFTTADTIPPKIYSTSPYYGETKVLLDSKIVVTFDEPMNISSISYYCSPDPGGWSINWSNGNRVASFSHNIFSSLTSYTFRITGGKDAAGNYLTSGYVSNPWVFTTRDVIGPEITSTNPTNGTTGVLLNANIVVTFSERMNTSSVTFTIKPNPGGWSTYWSNGDRTVTYTHNDFIGQTSYIFQITAAKDTSGNTLNPSVKNPWSFKTIDTTQPVITATSPKDQTFGVHTDAEVKITFSEEMNNATVSYVCNPNPGGWSVTWNQGNTEATFSHNLFNQNTNYTFRITTAKDQAGNYLAAGSIPNPFWFTTLDFDPPKIISAMPVNNSNFVELDAKIIIKFSERMDTPTIAYTCTPDPGGWSETWSADSTRVTYSHNLFNSSTNYTFQITAAKDASGNDFVKGSIPSLWIFTTKDAIAPKILSVTPIDGITDVVLNANVVVTFSETMVRSTVTFTCTPNPSGWTVVWTNDDSVATFMHDPFERFTSYTFQITAGKDLAGNELVAGAVANPWTFRTIQNTPPIILSAPIKTATEEVEYLYDVEAFDINNDDLTYTLTTQPSGLLINSTSGQIQWTPTNEQVGMNNVIILVSDGMGGFDTQEFNITVENTNDLPVITSNPILSATQNSLYTYQLEVVEVDVGDIITYTIQTGPTGMTIDGSTGILSWTPTNDQVGINSVILLVDDGAGGTDSQGFTIMVADVNDRPVINSKPVMTATEELDYYYDVEAYDIDDGDGLSYSLSTSPSGMVIDTSTGIITWTPTNEHVGSAFVTVKVQDRYDGLTTQAFNISVANVNDPPAILSDPLLGAREDLVYIYEVKAEDIDPTNDLLAYSLKVSPNGMEIDQNTGIITWLPTNDQVGLNDVVVHVYDGNGGGTAQVFVVTVKNDNDLPIITSEPVTTAIEDKQYIYHVKADDVDTDEVLTYYLEDNPDGMEIESNSGKITWTPTNDQVGENRVSVLVLDRRGDSAVQEFTIEVKNVNDQPEIASKAITSLELGTNYFYDVDSIDIDRPEDELVYTLIKYPIGMEINQETGEIVWTPTKEQLGSSEVTVQVSDGNGNDGKDSQTFVINVYQTEPVETDTEVKEGVSETTIYSVIGFIIILVIILLVLMAFYFRKRK
jgi:parallel beta-helix repeat protein